MFVVWPCSVELQQPNALSDEERQAILDRLDSQRLRDKSPRQAHAELLDDGEYLASPRTFARVLSHNDQSVDRQPQRQKIERPKPQLVAEDCNELWSWDTSPLATTATGVFFHLYVILDVFSRFAVRWAVELVESAEIAEGLFRSACGTYDVTTARLGVHADNGPIQRAIVIKDCFVELGITKTHSRPYTSNDNAYSESLFKTAKYQPTYPWQFETLQQAQTWADDCFTHYNYDHYHSGIAMLTPASVYFGTADEIIERRQETLDAAYAAHPERFRTGKPVAKRPEPAWINKPAETIPEEANPSSIK
jgi:putative transposase